MNIQEDYVSFEIAKLLKEKGFDEEVTSFYFLNGLLSHGNTYAHCKMAVSSNSDFILAPTLQMAMKWLREVHKIHIIAEPCLGEGNEPNLSFNRWFWTILKEEGEYKPIRKIDEFSTYEQAVEAACIYSLKNLI